MIRIKPQDLRGKDVGAVYDFPELTGEIIALANRLCQATTRKRLGNPNLVIEGFAGRSFEDWEKHFELAKPGALDAASREIYQTVGRLREALEKVDPELVRHWVEETVLKRTYASWRIQETILKRLAREMGKPFRLADDHEAERGVDGFIGEKPFNVRPIAHYFKAPPDEGEDGGMEVVYYEKAGNGLKVYYDL